MYSGVFSKFISHRCLALGYRTRVEDYSVSNKTSKDEHSCERKFRCWLTSKQYFLRQWQESVPSGMCNTGWSIGVRLTLDERSQHEVYVFAEKWTSSEATKQALFIVRYANDVNLQYEMCNVTNEEWREIWICNMNLYLVRIEFSWRKKRLGVIERSRCIDYFIELPAEITHPRRYRISSWVVTINTFRELPFVRCIVLASYFL